MTTYGDFESALDDGADCARLIELRDALPVDDKEHATMQLQRVGCFSPASKRTDSVRDHELYSVDDYRGSYREVADDPDQVYADAETREPQQAAGRYAQRFTGTTMHAAYVAALDALQGRPSRH